MQVAEKIIHAMSDAVFLIDVQGKIVFVNPALLHMIGYAKEDIIGRSYNMLFRKDYFTGDSYNELLLRYPSNNIETSLFSKNNKKIIVLFSNSIMYDDAGNINRVVCVARDITRAKQIEKELFESEQKLRNFVDSATDAFTLWDSELNLIDSNGAGFDLITKNISRNEVFGKNIIDLSPELKSTERYEEYMKVVITGKPFFAENVKLDPQHNTQYYDIKAFKVGDGMGMIISDVTKRKEDEDELEKYREHLEEVINERTFMLKEINNELNKKIEEHKTAETALLDSEELYRKLVSQLPDLIFIHKNGKILFVNDIVLKVLGYDMNDLIGSNLSGFVTDYYKDEFDILLNRCINEEGQDDHEMEIVTRDNRVLNVTCKGEKIIYENEDALLTVFTDITRLRALEQKLITEVIRIQEQERKRFAEDVHDGLGPLLASIKIHANVLGTRVHEEDVKGKVILKQTIAMIDNAISGSRNIANKIRPAVLGEYGLISAIKSYITNITGTSDIRIEFEHKDVPDRISEKIETNLYRIVMELILNTIKHASASSISVTLKCINNTFVLTFADDGTGFDPEKILKSKDVEGVGIKNIKSRIDTLHGRIKFNYQKQKGFNVKIEIA